MEANPVLVLTHNCLELTKKCIDSIRKQDIETIIRVVDNASSDGTIEWLGAQDDIQDWYFDKNMGVSAGWNLVLEDEFESQGADHVLVVNNDTALIPSCYRQLLAYDVPFVTGISVDEPKDHPNCWTQPAESPDFSLFLIRKSAWKAIGPFDENMRMYCSDCDWHIRAHQAGIKLLNAGVPFHHERSSTLRHASIFARDAIQRQADLDRQVFKEKWGCFPWEPGYQELLKENVNVR
jgi:GT2 family glycosyltransferase